MIVIHLHAAGRVYLTFQGKENIRVGLVALLVCIQTWIFYLQQNCDLYFNDEYIIIVAHLHPERSQSFTSVVCIRGEIVTVTVNLLTSTPGIYYL